ncbi:GNAT family N-acetyltransferase [Streptomyces rectiverticillatus]|uniref:GNAT family N-acetyltransferase n=1 Tax=Streptomyces rectiverticillatus TaxID=173860 RepID=UPI0015C30771|nr:GNAT family N-acetyltransferase [Streptomyces rectiverticillatus]QLE75586.1 GNAT family N-acetyltransferase [Streptomyces rectiverticillatus]
MSSEEKSHGPAPAESFYSSDPWLALLHDHGHHYRRQALSRDGRVAVVPLTDGTAVRSTRYRPAFLLRGRIAAERCTIAGPCSGYHNELRYEGEKLPAAAVAEELIAVTGGQPVLLPYLPSGPAADFEAAGHPAGPVAWEAWLDVPGTGFDSYLAGLGSTRRHQVRSDLRRLDKAGITFTTRPLAEPYEELATALVAHERKYDADYSRPPEEFARYLARCAEVPGAYVVRARLRGRTAGCHVVFHYRDVVWSRLIGVDESVPGVRGCYFGLMFYEPLRLAYRLGARAVHLGIGTSEAKYHRGARLEPLWTVAVTAPGRDRERAREGLADRARDLPDPVPEGAGPAPASPSEWSCTERGPSERGPSERSQGPHALGPHDMWPQGMRPS